MTISALDKNTVKLIKTTQIITSVCSAAKELIENALDANAKNIDINLVDNGCTLIEVKDDGCGISKADASYMALSSYTSKIMTFSDLDSLETYGFRGEALYALSAVSDLTIISKTDEDEVAISYDIDHHGHIQKSEYCHRATGTTVQVKKLFKQIPVRRQIISDAKKAIQDVKALEFLVKSYGMCKFHVRMIYKVDNIIRFAKPSVDTFEEAVTYTLGKRITSNMNWINIDDKEIKVKLMIPSKELKNESEVFQSSVQYIFVNNRPIKHKELEKMLTKTILKAMEQDSSCRKKPKFLVYILTSASDIDVNLEPNKTCILFKEENIIVNLIQKHVENFYGIEKEVRQENICDYSPKQYQECAQHVNIQDVENQVPVCKKRKLQLEENVNSIERNVCALQKGSENVTSLKPTITAHFKQNKEASISEERQNCQDKDKCEKNIEDFNVQLPSLDLSDSESNDSQKFTLTYSDNDFVDPLTKVIKKNANDSPPFELSPNAETLSQLPCVDLGEDFVYDDYSDMNTTEKENKQQSIIAKHGHEINKFEIKKHITLKEWSKGHIAGLKGGTDVQPYNYAESNKSSDNDMHRKNVCAGFVKFSKHIRTQVIKRNPNLTPPQIASTITNLWKELSSEERGYYRDLAREEKLECEGKKQELKEKHVTEIKKNRNRLLNALEKMKTTKPENQKNVVVRTVVPWDVDIKKVTESFLNNNTCKNTNVVVGRLHSDLWIVNKSSHLWLLDSTTLKKELHTYGINTSEDTVENMEQVLRQWFLKSDDLSILYPIHSLTQNRSIS